MEFYVKAEAHLSNDESMALFKLLGELSARDLEGYGLSKEQAGLILEMYPTMHAGFNDWRDESC
jgi:hypothetical protein